MDDNYYPLEKKADPRIRFILLEESKGKSLELMSYIAEKLNISGEITTVSMMKGFSIASGANCAYIRIKGIGDEPVWEIAPFEMFVRNAGGYATTPDGKQTCL